MVIAEPYREGKSLESTALPTRRRRLLVAVAVAAVVVAVGATAASCTSDGSDGASDPTSSTTAAAATPTDGAGQPIDPADQVVWQERSGAGLVPVSVIAAQVPAVTLYADGRIFVADRGTDTRYDHPIPFRTATVGKAAVDAFLAEVASSGLFADDVDFGRPEVTDLATTTVSAFVDGQERTVEVYALEASFEETLNGDEVDRRNSLRGLLTDAADLADDAEAWTPDRVRVTDLGTIEPAAGTPTPMAWPGPAWDEFGDPGDGDGEGCLEVAGGAAATVFDAAVGNPGITFTGTGEVHELVVAALLPGEVGCPT